MRLLSEVSKMSYEKIEYYGSRNDGHEIRYVCMHCRKILTPWERKRGYAFCYSCLNQLFRQKPDKRPLVISINGKSTLDDFLELQRWKQIEKNLLKEERYFTP